MKLDTAGLKQVLFSLKERVNLFYFLAFIPLFLILYFNLWSLVIAFYGFVFLLLKSQKLRSFKEARPFQRFLGLIVIVASFFLYYALIRIVSNAGFYGGANYVVFLLGLFMVFFDLPALREAFTPIFFIVAATSSSFVAEWLKPYFTPYLDDIAYIILNVLRAFGVNAYIYFFRNEPILGFTSVSGNLVLTSFVYECIGVFSALVFSIILVIVLIEDHSSLKVKLLASVVGVLGTFALNILRITFILLTDYFYGAEAGANVHYIVGYALFSAWLVFFLYIYSQRKTLQTKFLSLWRK